MKFLILLALSCSLIFAQCGKTVQNPYTGLRDCIGSGSSTLPACATTPPTSGGKGQQCIGSDHATYTCPVTTCTVSGDWSTGGSPNAVTSASTGTDGHAAVYDGNTRAIKDGGAVPSGGSGNVTLGAALVQSQAGSGVAVVTFQQNVTSGNLVVVAHHSESSTQTCADTLLTPFSLVRGTQLVICYGIATSSGADTVTVSSVGTDQETAVMEFRLLGLSGALDTSSAVAGTSTTLTTTAGNEIIVAAVGCYNSGKVGYPGLPLQQIAWLNGDDLLGVGVYVASAAGVYVTPFQLLTPGTYYNLAVSFK